MMSNAQQIKQDMCRVLKDSYDKGWITSKDGNVSFRDEVNNFYITPSGVLKYLIRPSDILDGAFDLHEGFTYPTGSTPSGEIIMHERLQYAYGGTTCAVLHVHPINTIALMMKGFNLQKVHHIMQELSRYTNVGPNVPALPICSGNLAKETNRAFLLPRDPESCEIPENGGLYDIVGQEGHGVTAIADSIWEAFHHVERLEHACEIILKSGISM